MDIKGMVANLSLEEKVALLTGRNNWETVAVERLGIPSLAVADGPHGVKKEAVDENGKRYFKNTVCFLNSSAMAATWNAELVGQVGRALGEECAALGVDVLLGPGTNIKRTPLCGRNFEYFSEDPLLAGEIAAAYINGVQSRGVGTSLKHFAVNNQEFDRGQISSEVDPRALMEIYLRPFEIAVKKAQPATIMCSYNRINGIYASENRFLLHDILREKWGFDGIVVSDWGAVHDRVKALKASLELEMPFCDKSTGALREAYENGGITEAEIDAAVERLLKAIFRVSGGRGKRPADYDADSHHELAKKAALEAITLMKNEDGILPIAKEKVKRIAVIGRFAKEPVIQGGGSACSNPTRVDLPLDRMLEIAGNDIDIEFTSAYVLWPWVTCGAGVEDLNLAMKSAAESDLAVVFAGNRNNVETEGYDRVSITLSPDMENIILRVAEQNPNTVVVLQAGSAVDMSAWIDRVKAVVFTWYTGQAGGSALAEILFGMANPCGKTAETFPCRLEDTPSYGSYPGNGYAVSYSEGIMAGYRYYDTYKKNVLFPFGHGLSYTDFAYSDLRISPATAAENETVRVSFKVKNTGKVYGKETAQIYVRDIVCKVLRPYKELKAFAKIGLHPGEEKEVSIQLDRDAFAYFNASINDWYVESGAFGILIGSSSRDIRLEGKVTIKSENDFS